VFFSPGQELMPHTPLSVRCREIGTADLDQIIDLLTNGYRISKPDFWIRRVKRLSEHSTPSGFPKYGYLLDYNGTPVGTIFTIFSHVSINNTIKLRCYLGSWYVAPEFRNYAVMLASYALRYKEVTYLNITPTTHVIPLLDAQGYTRFCSGRFIALPALSRQSDDARVDVVASDICCDDDFSPLEHELLLKHAAYGCISLTCNAASGKYPFVFHPRRKGSVVPFVRLIYCRDLDDFVRFSGPLGRFLISRGFPFVVLDANGPIDRLIGTYSSRFPKYFKGPDQPRLGNLAYSTRVIFDF
jgi:hypothetical protein